MEDQAPLDDWRRRREENLKANAWVSPPPGTPRSHPPEATDVEPNDDA